MGWSIDRQQLPPSLHLTITPAHVELVDSFLADLEVAALEVAGPQVAGSTICVLPGFLLIYHASLAAFL